MVSGKVAFTLLVSLLPVSAAADTLPLLPAITVTPDTALVRSCSLSINTIRTLPIVSITPELDEESYERGWAQALEDIENRAVAFKPYGLIRGYVSWDDSTGFVRLPSGGCVVTPEILGFSNGYYECIDTWIAREGLPWWSRKMWLPLLHYPKETYDSMAISNPATGLPIGGVHEAQSPDGKWRIHLSVGDGRRTVIVRDSTGQVHRDYEAADYPEEILDFVWGPEGSDVVVFRYTECVDEWRTPPVRVQKYRMMDLRSGRYAGTSKVELAEE